MRLLGEEIQLAAPPRPINDVEALLFHKRLSIFGFVSVIETPNSLEVWVDGRLLLLQSAFEGRVVSTMVQTPP